LDFTLIVYILLSVVYFFLCFFFFQAEDGIRDFHVTGVQTCALRIYLEMPGFRGAAVAHVIPHSHRVAPGISRFSPKRGDSRPTRSEERRVGKECRSRRSR